MRLSRTAILAGFVCASAPAQAAPPPAAAFGRTPAVADVAISPNGQRVAILGGSSDQKSVSIATIDDPNLPTLPLGKAEAVSLTWAGDDYVLARLAYWEKTGPRLAYRFERNVAITPQAQAVSRLLDGDAFSQYLVSQPVLGIASGPPARVFVMGLAPIDASGGMDTRLKRKGEEGWAPTLMKVDPATGKGARVATGDPDTISWELDAAGEPRVRLNIDELNHRFSVFAAGKGRAQWIQVWQGADFESRRQYMGYSAPEDAIYLLKGEQAVRRRLADGVEEAVGPSLANASPSMVWDNRRVQPVGIRTGGEKRQTHWLDLEIGAVHAALSKAFKGQEVTLHDWSADRSRFVLWTGSPTSPPVWYLFDKTRKELSPLGETYPELKGAELGRTSWITYKARDGLEIPAYLTLPPGAPAAGKLPLIVLPHGGPKSRDTYDFDFIVQFLATRGYAVLQPQFRGSWGFGGAFEKAGEGEWGGKMQTDLLDGIAAVAARGQIDPARVCIVGASFGGYAALAGATMHPASYKCAASIAGISDLGLLLGESGRAYGDDSGSFNELRATLGAATKGKLDATSPARLAGNVQAPILLIHGDQDTVVMPSQSELMASALKAAGKPYEYVVLQNENHYLSHSATRIQTLEALERFLAKNLPAG